MDNNGLMSLKEMMEHEWSVSWSGGKDSTATLILMHELGIPVRNIIYVRMMFDEETPATIPVMTDFVDRAKKVFEGWGYPVTVVKSNKTAMDLAKCVYRRSKFEDRNGHCYGITNFVRGMCKFTDVKQKTIKSLQDSLDYEMIGYACDETERLHRLGDRKQSVMVAMGVKENDTYDICRRYDLLSPLYDLGLNRDGCWFCPNAKPDERNLIRERYPELVTKIRGLIKLCDYDILSLYRSGRVNWMKDKDIYAPPVRKGTPVQLSLFDLFPTLMEGEKNV